MRKAVLAGQPVIVQVRFQALPGREELRGFVDHYIVVHGLDGEDFVYSDPYDRAGGGPRQVIGASALRRAMQTASTPGAAFAVYAPRARSAEPRPRRASRPRRPSGEDADGCADIGEVPAELRLSQR